MRLACRVAHTCERISSCTLVGKREVESDLGVLLGMGWRVISEFKLRKYGVDLYWIRFEQELLQVLLTCCVCMLSKTLGQTDAFCVQVVWQYHGFYACSFRSIIIVWETKQEMRTKFDN